jgi:hypothetical protein
MQRRYGKTTPMDGDDDADLSKPKMSPSMQMKEFHPFKDKAERDKVLEKMSHQDVLDEIKKRLEKKQSEGLESAIEPLGDKD